MLAAARPIEPGTVETSSVEASRLSGGGSSLGGAPSFANALTQYQHRAIEMMRNGPDPRIAACCNPSRPPTSSIADATAPINAPIVTTTIFAGLMEPRDAMVAIVIAPASAPLTKNKTISRTLSPDVNSGIGSTSNAANSADCGDSATAASRSARPDSWMSIDVPPTAANQRNPKPVGAAITPRRNSRIVRPREMRATNIPTKGPHEYHHAQ